MHQFIDIQSWPLVYLHMPAQVADQDADAALAQITALYARAERFVLVLDGAQLPRHSVRFMRAYTQWSRKNLALQKCFCAGAVRMKQSQNDGMMHSDCKHVIVRPARLIQAASSPARPRPHYRHRPGLMRRSKVLLARLKRCRAAFPCMPS